MSTAAPSSFPEPLVLSSRLRRLCNPPPYPRRDSPRNSEATTRTFSIPRKHGQTQKWHASFFESQGEEAQECDPRHRSCSRYCNVTHHVLSSDSFPYLLICIFTSHCVGSLVAHVFLTSQPLVVRFLLHLLLLLFSSFPRPTDQSLPSSARCRRDCDRVNHKLL